LAIIGASGKLNSYSTDLPFLHVIWKLIMVVKNIMDSWNGMFIYHF
jgi:hypothetical protein